MELYSVNGGEGYPTQSESMTCDDSSGPWAADNRICDGASLVSNGNVIMMSMPSDPNEGIYYGYTQGGGRDEYCISTKLEQGGYVTCLNGSCNQSASDCKPIEANVDSDNDGLNDKDEIIYGTDSLNPDTDGDGYNDGDEVENGYNPNGEGRL